ncbi:uncharacterized protein cubi_01673 [Cryptosporidium ubiquitum]|uniref:Uncharacterized protein n=1 Tax=Cryptosporidium ubiquitum TaxID=857276 RepID=A0A1J4MGY5_9CRYT|nr:uncharacterized protein cubi_01673 [Cryptosporidium ubiquitum]OII72723.1 hypothetical protein cubi_01673 [Cryptosporidium ubiquitum]
MGCCATKDVSALKNTKSKKDNHSSKLFQNIINSNIFENRLLFFRDLINVEQSNYKNKDHASSIEFIHPQMKELHAIWIISMLKKLRSEIDTIFLLSRLIEIMELLDPLDGDSIIRNHMYESGAVEILSNIIKYHKRSPEIVLICIFLLTHLSFNDGISEKMVLLIIPEILELFTHLEKNFWSCSANNTILMAIFRLIFISSSDSLSVSEIWVDSNIGKKIVLYLKDENVDERTQVWGFAALKFLIRSSLKACNEFLKLGVFELITAKLGKNQDLFLIENIFSIYVSILSTSQDFKFNNPNILKEILEIIDINVNNAQIVQQGLIILIISCQRTEVYSHIVAAHGAKKIIQSIINVYRKNFEFTQITKLSKQLLKCLCSFCSKTTSIKLVNNQLVFSRQFDPGRFNIT